MQEEILKPIVKWAGGKTQLLHDISFAYPDGLGNNMRRYAEPFVGGGAVLFDILSKFDLDEVYIGDVNAELINMYLVVRDQVDDLIFLLSNYQREFSDLNTEEQKQYYYCKRDDFNNLIIQGKSKSGVLSAALFIFLNRTCFNGLYRANQNGLFNVPKGSQKNPTICNEKNIRSVARALSNIQIVCADYHASKTFIDENTFVYLDPPYRPLPGRDNFISYTVKNFDDSCQRELSGFVEEINARGASIMLSNSDPKSINENDNFFDDLYADYDIQRVLSKRIINRNTDDRKFITELLIKNY